jgi:mxaJ protein
MCSAFRSFMLLCCCASAVLAAEGQRVLRIAADPNNLPFSNEKREGFENKIADIIAQELGATVEYRWRAMRRGFVREELNSGAVDIVMGVPSDFDMALTTAPYYQSSYVFVSRSQSGISIASFDDPMLKRVKVAIQLTGEANPPPAVAMARRRIVDNVSGYTVFGDYSQPNPTARIMEAVARGDVDVAVVWGPVAGFFAAQQPVKLDVTPVTPQIDPPALPMTFRISIGLKKRNDSLRDELDRVLEHRKSDIDGVLDDYHVPRVGARKSATPQAGRESAREHADREEVPGCCE